MAKKYLQIQIPTPCSEDFSKMTAVEKGHFCNNCEKVVIDFSKMSDQEIANFYKKNGGKLCGRFHHSQLNRDIRLTQPKVNSMFGKAAGLVLTGMLSAGATNVTAQVIEYEEPTEIVQFDNEIEDKKDNKFDKKQFKKVRFLIEGSIQGENLKPIDGKTIVQNAHIIHLTTKISGTTDSLGFLELNIPTSYFENDDMSFEISHHSNKRKRVSIPKMNFKENTISKVVLEYNNHGFFLGNIATTVSDMPGLVIYDTLGIGTTNDFAKLTEFEFKKVEEDSLLRETDFFEKPSLISPIGLAIKNVYPNPFINKINLKVSVEKNGIIQINLVDISGRVVFQKEEQTAIGTQQFRIEVGNLSLSGNLYILQVKDQSGNMQSQQLMRYTNHGFTMR